MGRWLLILIAVAAAIWWLRKPAPSLVHSSGAATAPATIATACALPPSLAGGDGPVQSATHAGMAPFALESGIAKPLAGFSVDARVLSRKEYGSDREADFAPVDLALGWGRMKDDAVLSRLEISQGGRWYRYQWRGQPPIPPDEIVRSSANMHMIPANAAIADALDDIGAGQRVRIDGWLVQVETPDGWRWRSSLSREDSGDGSCEVVYVCAVSR